MYLHTSGSTHAVGKGEAVSVQTPREGEEVVVDVADSDRVCGDGNG